VHPKFAATVFYTHFGARRKVKTLIFFCKGIYSSSNLCKFSIVDAKNNIEIPKYQVRPSKLGNVAVANPLYFVNNNAYP
jgi:hypothetical protein